MRRSTKSRLLSNEEWALAREVFTSATLPPSTRILVRDGLGLEDRPWTNHEGYAYEMMLGDVFDQDLTKKDPTSRWMNGNYGRLCDLFVHEMVHVWQYYRGYRVKNGAVLGWLKEKITGDDAYTYTPGKDWGAYNPEEQASIVEDWYKAGAKEDNELFPYVRYVIRNQDKVYEGFTLAELKELMSIRPVEPLPAATLKVVVSAPYYPEDWIEKLLQKRFLATDVKGYRGRLEELKSIFSSKVPKGQAKILFPRFEKYNPRDKLSKYFREHLSGAERAILLQVLRIRAA
ncbi:MAG: hypothetical protein HY820_28055 [Acidobacteria bacterium]|nr:hypothetical protein [Acidobacteriota bacterium]